MIRTVASIADPHRKRLGGHDASLSTFRSTRVLGRSPSACSEMSTPKRTALGRSHASVPERGRAPVTAARPCAAAAAEEGAGVLQGRTVLRDRRRCAQTLRRARFFLEYPGARRRRTPRRRVDLEASRDVPRRGPSGAALRFDLAPRALAVGMRRNVVEKKTSLKKTDPPVRRR